MIPCFREGARLPVFLPKLLDCLDGPRDYEVQIRIVDDGSGAEEAAILAKLVEAESGRHPGILKDSLMLPDNRGKGGAIYAGWDKLANDCDWLAFVDADGAVPADETCRLMAGAASASTGMTAIFGERSRAKTVRRNPLRRVVGWAFQVLVRSLVPLPLHDTQCGIKVLPSAAFRAIRGDLHREDFAFDIELAMALLDHGYSITPVPVRWQEQPGSHMRVRHVVAMAIAVLGFGVRRVIRARKPDSPIHRGQTR